MRYCEQARHPVTGKITNVWGDTREAARKRALEQELKWQDALRTEKAASRTRAFASRDDRRAKQRLDELSGILASAIRFDHTAEPQLLAPEFLEAIRRRDGSAVATFLAATLERSPYPEGIAPTFLVSWECERSSAVVQITGPELDVVPTDFGGRRVLKGTGKVVQQAADESERWKLYNRILSALLLRVAFELFDATPEQLLGAVYVDCMVPVLDEATGYSAYRCVLSAGLKRADVLGLLFDRVDPAKALAQLGASSGCGRAALHEVDPLRDGGGAPMKQAADWELERYTLSRAPLERRDPSQPKRFTWERLLLSE